MKVFRGNGMQEGFEGLKCMRRSPINVIQYPRMVILLSLKVKALEAALEIH